jgi:hypothetical protein
MSRPHCLNCGKPIPKKTESHDFWVSRWQSAPRTREEAQRLTNHQIVSIRYGISPHTGEGGVRYVSSFSTWDGESYNPCYGHFDSGECAKMFAYRVANRGVRLRNE